jgi:hypothetical protein
MGDGIGVFELVLGAGLYLHSLLGTMSSLEAGSEILESAQKKAET